MECSTEVAQRGIEIDNLVVIYCEDVVYMLYMWRTVALRCQNAQCRLIHSKDPSESKWQRLGQPHPVVPGSSHSLGRQFMNAMKAGWDVWPWAGVIFDCNEEVWCHGMNAM